MQDVKEKVKKKIIVALLPYVPIIAGISIGFLIIIGAFMGAVNAGTIRTVAQITDLPSDVLQVAFDEHMKDRSLDFIGLVTYEAAELNFDWKKHKNNIIQNAAAKVKGGGNIADLLEGGKRKTYDALYPMFEAILKEYIGEYDELVRVDTETEVVGPDGKITVEEGETIVTEKRYGVKNYYPMAQGFLYIHNDDFGDPRSYKGQSSHDGNDIMAIGGTPIVSVEDGYIENLGWNEWGGYRVGVRSFDRKRYYYYAHLYRDHPYANGLVQGATVKAGDVIGFVGATGYSPIVGTTGLFADHLHIQIEVTYDINGKKTNSYVDPYGLLKFLEKNRMAKLESSGPYQYTRAPIN